VRSGSNDHLKRYPAWGGLALLIMVTVTACASWPDTYFRKAVNQATQDMVAKELGPPLLSRDLTSGEAVWSYEFRDRFGCNRYIVAFDRARILRQWQWQTCL
jgi:hypothetical protein